MKNKIIKFNCIYTFNNNVSNTSNWEAFIYINHSKDDLYNIEGFLIDKNDNLENKSIHKRYLLGLNGYDVKKNILSFTIFHGEYFPIVYQLLYDEDDKCFYGTWESIFGESLNDKKLYDVGFGYAKVILSKEYDYSIKNFEKERNIRWFYYYDKYKMEMEKNLNDNSYFNYLLTDKNIEDAKNIFNKRTLKK